MRDASGKVGYYRPIIFPNDFWHLKEQYVEINTTTRTLPLQVVFQPMSYLKFQMFASMTVGFEQAAQQQGSGAELDEIKRMFVETNPWFLALTAAVSLLHMLCVHFVHLFLRPCLTPHRVASRCSHLRPMSPTGATGRSLSASPSVPCVTLPPPRLNARMDSRLT